MMRQSGKQILTLIAWALLSFAAQAGGVVTSIVTDPLTGVAIDGYDPVSYFTESEPEPGMADYEYVWGGVSWYFASAANRDVFIRNPDVYAPQYGGHCVTSLARGYVSDGKAKIYVVDALKLYLFYSSANRDAFMLSRSTTLMAAASKWTALSQDLTGVAEASLAPFAEGAQGANDEQY